MDDATIETPKTYDHIQWEDYLTNEETEAVELVLEWISENVRVRRTIPTYFTGYLDGSPMDIDDLDGYEIEVEDETDRDDYDYDDQNFLCNHCNKEFSYTSSYVEHALEVLSDEIEELTKQIMTWDSFFELVREHIFEDKDALLLTLVRFVIQDRGSERFLRYAKRYDLIPSEVWTKFEEYQEV